MRNLKGKRGMCFLVSFVVLCSNTPLPKYPDIGMVAGHKVSRVYRGTDDNTHSTNLAVPVVLFEDHDGVYWVGTLPGVFSYDETTDRWNTLVDDRGNPAPRFVDRVCQSSDGKLWFRSAALHYLVTYRGGQWRKVENVQGVQIRPSVVLLTSGSGRVWIVQEERVLCYNNGHWNNPISPPDGIERSLGENSAEKLPSEAHKRITSDVSVGIEDRDGDLWLGTRKAILRFKNAEQEWMIYPLPEGFAGVFVVYEDSVGRIWFADTKGHVSAYNKSKNFWSPAYNPSERVPTRRDRPSLPPFAVKGICQDRSGQMMFASDVGLISFKEDKNEWAVFTPENSGLPEGHITSIMEDRKGRIWLGTGKGIVVLEP